MGGIDFELVFHLLLKVFERGLLNAEHRDELLYHVGLQTRIVLKFLLEQSDLLESKDLLVLEKADHLLVLNELEEGFQRELDRLEDSIDQASVTDANPYILLQHLTDLTRDGDGLRLHQVFVRAHALGIAVFGVLVVDLNSD